MMPTEQDDPQSLPGKTQSSQSSSTRNNRRVGRESLITHLSQDTNKGDLAILEGTVRLVKDIAPGTDFHFHSVEAFETEFALRHSRALSPKSMTSALLPPRSAGLRRYATRLLVSVASLINPRLIGLVAPEFLEALDSASRVICKGGSYLFSRGTMRDNIFLCRMLFPMILVSRSRVPFVVLGISVGPIRNALFRALTRRVLSGAEFVGAREELSEDYLRNVLHLPPEKLIRIPDLAFYGGDISGTVVIDGPAFGVTPLAWKDVINKDPQRVHRNYVRTIIRCSMDHIEKGRRCVLIAHSLDDLPIVAFIEDALVEAGHREQLVTVRGDLTTSELRGVYKQLDFLIATRLHSVILAATVGTPSVAIAYEVHKAFGIMRDLGMEQFTCELNSCDTQLEGLVNDLERSHTSVSGLVGARAALLRRELIHFGQERLAPFLTRPGGIRSREAPTDGYHGDFFVGPE